MEWGESGEEKREEEGRGREDKTSEKVLIASWSRREVIYDFFPSITSLVLR